MTRTHTILILFFTCFSLLSAQPEPGDVFRDYIWKTPDNSTPFLRVIADGDYRSPVTLVNELPEEIIRDGWIQIGEELDLKQAIKAELQVEMLLSHDETTGLAVKINNSSWHDFKMPDAVPEPKAAYLQHNYPLVSIPLQDLEPGDHNRIRFRVDSLQRFGMPQHILYGIRLRIYYDADKKHPSARILGPDPSGLIGQSQDLELTDMQGDIAQVRYLGLFKDVNLKGDGISRQWQYTFFRCDMMNHIGSSSDKPFRVSWETSWLPDQEKEILVSAWLTDKKGITYFLPPIEKLSLDRDFSVELCVPHHIPQKWATREGVLEERIRILGNPQLAHGFQMVFTSWSPGYLNGIYVNDWLVPTSEDCNYCYRVHRIEMDKSFFLRQGENSIKTGKTPLKNGNMVHGTEIQFPGIMLLVKYPKPAVSISEEVYRDTPHFKVSAASATYYIEKQSGGCSSLIDMEGRDWVTFKKTGTEGPTLSSDSDYRGIPNLVWKEPGSGVGHPGFESCTTTRVAENELLVRSLDQNWQFRWIFHASYAELSVEKTDLSRHYWFLYEGPVAGQFAPGNQYWGNSTDGLRTDKPSIFKDPESGQWQWVFFGDRTANTTLFVAQQKADDLPDFFAYMGNNAESGNLSVDGMNVFGFGRHVKTAPLMNEPMRFFLGFFPEKVLTTDLADQLGRYINQIIQ